jgi:ankyrin repeat protein
MAILYANIQCIEWPTITIALGQSTYALTLDKAIAHITSYQKIVRPDGEKICGLHHYTAPERKDTVTYQDGTLYKINPMLWVFTPEDTSAFHTGYVIYKGKAYDKPKTFFPANWSKQDIVNYIQHIVTTGSLEITSESESPYNSKTFTLIVKPNEHDANHKALVPLTIVLHGYPALQNSMHIVTLYPTLPKLRKKPPVSLRALELQQMHAIQQSKQVKVANPELIAALYNNNHDDDYTTITRLLNNGADPNVTDNLGKTPLMIAARKGELPLISKLLDCGADQTAIDTLGNTCLHHAIASGNYYAVLGLIDTININKPNKEGITPLSAAVQANQLDIVELLLEYKADPTIPDKYNQTPLIIAAKSSYNHDYNPQVCQAIVQLLLASSADLNAQDMSGNTALILAATYNNGPIGHLLLQAEADYELTNTKNKSALNEAQNHCSELALSLEKLINDKQNWLKEHNGTNLMYAVYTNNIPKATELLSRHVPLDAQAIDGETALFFAVQNNNTLLVKALLDAGADPRLKILSTGLTVNDYAQTSINTSDTIRFSLQEVTTQLDAPLLEQLRQKKEKKEQQERELARKHLESFSTDLKQNMLSQETLDNLPHFKDKILNKTQFTPLLYAVNSKKYRVVEQLLTCGVNTQAQDINQRDGLMIALDNNDNPMLQLLISSKLFNQNQLQAIWNKAFHDKNGLALGSIATQVPEIKFKALISHIRKENNQAVEFLLEQKGAQLTIDQAGQCLLEALQLLPAKTIAQTFLNFYPSLINYADNSGKTLVMEAARLDKADIVSFFCGAGADVAHTKDNQHHSALDYAPAQSDAHIMLRTLHLKEQHKIKEEQERQVAAQQLAQLQAKEQELRNQGWTLLMIAAHTNNAQAIQADTDSDVNQSNNDGLTSLMVSVQSNSIEATKALIDKPTIDLNKQDNNGDTALMHAIQANSHGAANELTTKDASLFIINNNSQTAINLITDQTNAKLKQCIMKAHDKECNRIKKLIQEHQAFDTINTLLQHTLAPYYLTMMLIEAIDKCNDQVIDLLLDSGKVPINSAEYNGTTPLMSAIVKGNSKLVKKLLSTNGINVNTKNSNTTSALMLGVNTGSLDIVKLLLSVEGIDINAHEPDGVTALIVAINNNELKIAEALLNTGKVNVNLCDELSNSPLICAVGIGSLDMVKLLLNVEDININAQNSSGNTALIIAVAKGKLEIVEALLNTRKVNVNLCNRGGDSPLMYAVGRQSLDITKLLLSVEDININAQNSSGDTPFFIAVAKGKLEIIEALVNTGKVNVNLCDALGASSLMIAIHTGASDIVKLLLSIEGIDINAQTNNKETALSIAINNNKPAIVEALLNTGKVNINLCNGLGDSPLMYAVTIESLDIVKLLLSVEDININAQNSSGNTPFIIAVAKGKLEIIEALLNTGKVNVNLCDKLGNSPLMGAINAEALDIVNLLLSIEGIDINAQRHDGTTPLIIAINKNKLEIIEALLNTGKVNVNLCDKLGNSPLMVAIHTESLDIVKLLLSVEGININTQRDDRITALIIAISKNKLEIVEALLNTGKVNINLCSKLGNSPLMIAVNTGALDIVKLLLSVEGININAQRHDGITAFTLALYTYKFDIAEALHDTGKVDVNLCPNNGFSPLMWASRPGPAERKSITTFLKKISK